jgi:hypothetical protein
MSEDGTGRVALILLAGGSIVLFWVPLVAPLVQAWTLVESCRALRRPGTSRAIALLGVIGAVAGFALFMASEYLWLV